MSDEIKSAREIALARVAAQTEEITAEDRTRWKYIPDGEKLGGRIIAGEVKIEDELGKYEESARKYLVQGALSIIYSKISLPYSEAEKQNSSRALDAVVALKKDKAVTKQIVEQIRNLFEHYEKQGEKQKNQAIEQLKVDYSQKLKQAVAQQLGSSASGVLPDVENLPQYKEEKRRLINRFDSQYVNLLNDYKEELKKTG